MESCKFNQMKLMRTFGNLIDKVFLDNFSPIQVVTHNITICAPSEPAFTYKQ